MWFNLAAPEFGPAGVLRDGIAGKMTPSQIAQAQELARNWKPKKSLVHPQEINSIPEPYEQAAEDLSRDWPKLKHQAVQYTKSGDYSRAELYLRQALKIEEQIFGQGNVKLADTVSKLIYVCEKQGKQDEVARLNNLANSLWGPPKQ
jgi:hypothetical protein